MTIMHRRDLISINAVERLLNRTTLTTQRVLHNHIIDIGSQFVDQTQEETAKDDHCGAIKQELEERHRKELRHALKRLQKGLLAKQEETLQKEREHFEEIAKKVAKQRDQWESERLRVQKQKWECDKSQAVEEVKDMCEKQMWYGTEEAVAYAMESTEIIHKRQNELEIKKALKRAEDEYQRKEEQIIKMVKDECQAKFMAELQDVTKKHKQVVEEQLYRYQRLELKYTKLLQHTQSVEKDFAALQDDYRRFIDYTDGAYKSDYLMMLRSYGLSI